MKRRIFLKNTASVATGAWVAPTIIPSSVLGKNAPSNKINVGQIGCGRIAISHDMPGTMKHDVSRMVAVCDVDSIRMEKAKKFTEDYYKKKQQSC